MRVMFSLAALLIVLVTVWKLVGSQLGGTTVRSAPADSGAATLPAGAAPRQVPQEVLQQVQRGLEAGTAARASEPGQ